MKAINLLRKAEHFLQIGGDSVGAFEWAQEARLLAAASQNSGETKAETAANIGGFQFLKDRSLNNRRKALVVGNKDYLQGPLQNPINDAEAIANALAALSFDVQLIKNLTRDNIGSSLEKFAAELQPGDDVVFFYAGHGAQVRGTNYLLAIDANIRSEGDVPLNSINLDDLLERLDERRAGVRLVLIDACRDNPYKSLTRSGSAGLSRMNSAPAGSLIQFATRPGSTASDGDGEHGLYTRHLLRAMRKPEFPIEMLLKTVSAAVRRASGGEQSPWMEGSLDGEFFLAPPSAAEN